MPQTRELTVANLDAPIATGTLVLVAGTVTDAAAGANHTDDAQVYISRAVAGGGLGELLGLMTGASLTVTSDDNSETSTVNYLIIG